MKKFLGVYYEWGYDEKGTYVKMTMEKYIKKLVEGYEKCNGMDIKVQKTPGDLVRIISKSELEEYYNAYKNI